MNSLKNKSETYIHSEAIDFYTYSNNQDWFNAKRILNRTPEIINYEIKTLGCTIGNLVCSDYDSYKEIAFDILNCPNINLNIPDNK